MGKAEDTKGNHPDTAFLPDETFYWKLFHDQVLFEQQIN